MSRMSMVAVAAIAVGALACGGGGTEPGPDPEPNQGSITISPGTMTLSIGGRGTLAAEVRNASGATISATVSWTSRNGLVAAIDNGGTITGIAVGQTMAVATANGMRDSVLVIVLDDLTLQVTPASGTVQPGGTFPFTVVARNGAGQVIAAPAVTWATSSTSIATVSSSGLATGVAKGTAFITASARGVTSTPGVLTVADAAGACDGIGAVQSWQATLDYQYGVRGTTEGGFEVNSDNKGNVTATLTAQSPQIEPLLVWKGKLNGTASLHETKSGSSSDVTKLDGEGQVVTIALGYEPTMSLIVDTRNCSYRMTAIMTLSLRRTEFGQTTTLEAPVATVQVGQNTALGPWKQLNLSDLAEGGYPGHSELWLGAHPDKNGFAALGFATELTKRSFEEPNVGNATVSWSIIRKN